MQVKIKLDECYSEIVVDTESPLKHFHTTARLLLQSLLGLPLENFPNNLNVKSNTKNFTQNSVMKK